RDSLLLPSLRTLMTLWIGIDVAKATLAACVRPEGRCITLPNTPQGHAQMLALMANQPVGNILLDATGGYARALMAAPKEAGPPGRGATPPWEPPEAMSAH